MGSLRSNLCSVGCRSTKTTWRFPFQWYATELASTVRVSHYRILPRL